MKRAAIIGFLGAMAMSMVLVAPSAQAATPTWPSTVCSFVMKAKFHDGGLVHGLNRRAFFTWHVTFDGCTGGVVNSAVGYGGSEGDLFCANGALQGLSSAKMQVYWDTGNDSGINFQFDFDRSRFGGRVTGERFKGERVRARHIVFTPTKGDCESAPLVHAKITGSVSL